MKTTIKFAALCCCAVLALVFTSCEETVTTQQVYKFGISQFNGNADNLLKVEPYLIAHGAPVNEHGGSDATVIIEGKSDKDCDKQAEAKFHSITAALSYEEIAALGVTASFTYSATRYESDNTTIVTIGEWKYPKE